MSSQQSGEGDIRKAMIEANIVDCMVALPGQLFYSTQIPACLWILAKDRSNGLVRDTKLRDRRGEVLFIDARKMGELVDRTRRELTEEEISHIGTTTMLGEVKQMPVNMLMSLASAKVPRSKKSENMVMYLRLVAMWAPKWKKMTMKPSMKRWNS